MNCVGVAEHFSAYSRKTILKSFLNIISYAIISMLIKIIFM